MKRINIHLPTKTIDWLKCNAKEKGISMAEFIRRIIDGYIDGASKK